MKTTREVRNYDMEQDVKNIIISVEELRYSKEIAEDLRHYPPKVAPKIIENAKQEATYLLLKSVEQFVQCSVSELKEYVTAIIYLPYVKDNVVTRLEGQIKRQNDNIVWCEQANKRLNQKINDENNKWWRKLFGIKI